MSRGFGVTAGLDPEIASPLAARCQELGYASMWSNDHPGAKGLETLADYAKGADRIELGVAVVALDRASPGEIAADIDRLGLDRERLWLGLGSGFTEKPLTTMREALPKLRDALPGIRLVLAAMGPKMCAFGGAEWDGVFFNWMTRSSPPGREGRGGRPRGRTRRAPVFGYVRTAVGANAEERLAKDESFYRDLHQGYRSHFERLGEPEGTVGVAAENAGVAQTELSRYRALDTVVVGALASANIEDMSALAEARSRSLGAWRWPPSASSTGPGTTRRAGIRLFHFLRTAVTACWCLTCRSTTPSQDLTSASGPRSRRSMASRGQSSSGTRRAPPIRRSWRWRGRSRCSCTSAPGWAGSSPTRGAGPISGGCSVPCRSSGWHQRLGRRHGDQRDVQAPAAGDRPGAGATPPPDGAPARRVPVT